MMNEKEGPSKGACISIRVENDGGISANSRGNKIDLVYLWSVLGGQISRETGLAPKLLGMMFLSMSEEFANIPPDKHTRIDLSAVERAKEAADHAED